MNRYRQLFAGFAATTTALIVYGCDSKAPGADIVEKPPAKVNSSPPTPPKIEAPAVPKTDLDRSKLPASLNTDAYHYYGLSSSKPLDMEMTLKPNSGIVTGSLSYRMSQVDQDSATFVMETTGALNEKLGNETLKLKPGGLSSVSSSLMKLSSPELELPTGLTSGKSWRVDSTAESNSGKVRQQMKFLCEGPQNLKIGAKTYQALYVIGVGTVSLGAQKSHVTMKEWFVKDIGTVKMEEIGQTPKGKPSVTFDMIWKPNDSKAKP